MWRSLARVVALALLLFTGGVGVYNGLNEWRDVTNGLQAVVTGGVFGYGVLGLASVAAALRRWPATRGLVAAWGADVTMVATLAPLAYGGPDVPLGGTLAGGAATALIAAGVWWATVSTARPAMSGEPVRR
ncbi:MAG TPA: hypothetical protein VFZ21_04495 [Gemmatimonadaceae bacterium]|jgi:hypothetical protein|nr:hypothetical protein [Gemmatimonadaceae bacterium]